MHQVVIVQFSREGERDGVSLDPATPYLVRIDGGPPHPFHPPWTQDELEDLVEKLRNKGEEKPTSERLAEAGKHLGEALHRVPGMERSLDTAAGPVTVVLQLDYPELARIPWELATTNEEPFHHLFERGVSIVRRVPGSLHDEEPEWPTGRNQSLRLLFVSGETAPGKVPREAHLEALTEVCTDYGIELVHEAIDDAESLGKICGSGPDAKGPFHFVHILAHGARASDGDWGLQLGREIARGEAIARALRAGQTTPALVTLAACDSSREDNSFGSVAYELHSYGVPLVMASQFRLRKDVSISSAGSVYRQLLGGGDPRDLLKSTRLELAIADNEAWANEVVYSRYRDESLEELAVVARQQGALRRATVIEKAARNATEDERPTFIGILDDEAKALEDLIDRMIDSKTATPASLAETHGLRGSLLRRKARLRAGPPDEDPEELEDARAEYLLGLGADANSHYCGINVIHLSLRLGETEEAEEYIPIVRFAAKNQVESDFWALATAGELEVYAGDVKRAREHYREFARAVAREVDGKADIERALRSPQQQLQEIQLVDGLDEAIRDAASKSIAVLDSALGRID